MLSNLKVLGTAFLAFLASLFAADYYRTKARHYKRQVIKEKAKLHNYEAQLKAAKRKNEIHRKEIEDAVEDDSYLNYFDD